MVRQSNQLSAIGVSNCVLVFQIYEPLRVFSFHVVGLSPDFRNNLIAISVRRKKVNPITVKANTILIESDLSLLT